MTMHTTLKTGQRTLTEFFRVVGDDERLRIIGCLAIEGRRADELASVLAMKPASVVRHLAMLESFGLVRPDASRRYSLDFEALRDMRKDLLTRESNDVVAADAGNDEFARKVLQNNFDGERLLQIPVNRRKKDVVLNWLANQFEHDVTYSEQQVNEIIERHHPDCAALRRELVDGRWLQRTAGGQRYWRTPDTN